MAKNSGQPEKKNPRIADVGRRGKRRHDERDDDDDDDDDDDNDDIGVPAAVIHLFSQIRRLR